MGIFDGYFGNQSGLLGELPPWMNVAPMTGYDPSKSDWLRQALGIQMGQGGGFQPTAPQQPDPAAVPPNAQFASMPPQQPQMEPRKSIFDPPDSYPGAPPLDRPNFGAPLGAPQMPQAQPQQAPGMTAMAQAPQQPQQAGGSNPLRGVLGFLGDTLMHGPLGAVGGAINANRQQATFDRLVASGVDPKQAWFIMNAPQQGQLAGVIGPRESKAPDTKEFETVDGKVPYQWDANSKKWVPVPGVATGKQPEKPPAGYAWKDPKDPTKGLDPIAGGPATHLPAETAGRIAMMETAQKELPSARDILMKERGALGQYPGAALQYTTGIGEVGRAKRSVRIGIEATLRAMTGAAAPQSEVDRYEDMFLPKPTDNPETAKQKLDLLDNFMTSARSSVTQGRVPSAPAPQSSLGPPEPKKNDPMGLR